MKTIVTVTTAMLLGLFFSTAVLADAQSFSPERRVEDLKKIFAAFHGVRPRALKEIEEEVALSTQSKCKSVSETMTLSCLRGDAQENCRSVGDSAFHNQCPLISDVLLVNAVNEKFFVTQDELLKAINLAGSGHADEVEKKLLGRKYALLATEFLSLSKRLCHDGDLDCLAEEVDSYCARRADVKNLTWQACASALVWFIGGPPSPSL